MNIQKFVYNTRAPEGPEQMAENMIRWLPNPKEENSALHISCAFQGLLQGKFFDVTACAMENFIGKNPAVKAKLIEFGFHKIELCYEHDATKNETIWPLHESEEVHPSLL